VPRRWSSRKKELELIATSKAEEVELKQREVQLKLLSKKNLVMTANLTTMPPAKRALFEKRQKEIQDRSN
jgi:hypothetical protein